MELSDIIKAWKNSDIQINLGVTLIEIDQLEKHLEFEFPDSFKQFYTQINGFKDYDMDENMFTMFPIERIKEEYDLAGHKDFIPFCDYLINSHQIGFSKIKKGIYIDYLNLPGGHENKVADNFELSMIEIFNNSDKV